MVLALVILQQSNRADMGVCVKLNPNVATKGPFWRGVMKGDYVRTLIDKYAMEPVAGL